MWERQAPLSQRCSSATPLSGSPQPALANVRSHAMGVDQEPVIKIAKGESVAYGEDYDVPFDDEPSEIPCLSDAGCKARRGNPARIAPQ